MDEIFFAVLTASISLLVGGATREFLNRVFPSIFKRVVNGRSTESSHSERLQELLENLRKSSREVDAVINELQQVALAREQAAKKLEADLEALSERESQLKTNIEHLEKVPLPVAEYFAELSKPSEQKSARRDYILFGAGIIFSVVTAIALKQLGLA